MSAGNHGRKHAQTPRHPLVEATDKLEAELKQEHPQLWPALIEMRYAELCREHGQWAPYVRWGVRERLKLIDHTACPVHWDGDFENIGGKKVYTGCWCKHKPKHSGDHKCECGATRRKAA